MTYQPKSYRKFLATSVAAAMVATVAAPLAGAAGNFNDVAAGDWYAGDVDYLVEKGAINGDTNGNFNPSANLTRGEAAKILALTLGLDVDPDAEAAFADLAGHWASPFVKAVQDQKPGVINGRTDGTFDANGTITRQEMAKMTVEAYNLELDETVSVSFPDNIGWGANYIEVLASLGVVQGSNGMFNPDGQVTRAESVAFVHRTEQPSVRINPESGVVDLQIVGVSALTDDGRVLSVELNKAPGTLTKADVKLYNSKNLSRVGVETVEVLGNTVEVTLYDTENSDEISRLTPYTIEVQNVKHEFSRPGYLDSDDDAYVESVDLEKGEITIDHSNGGVNGGSDVILTVPEGMDLDLEEALGQVVRIWFDSDDNIIDFEYETNSVQYDAIEVDDTNGELELVGADEELDLAAGYELFVDGSTNAIGLDDTYDYAKVITNEEGDVVRVYAYNWADGFVIVESVEDDVIFTVDNDELDVEDFVIVKDGRTISAAELSEGDIVFFNDNADNRKDEKGYAEVFNNTATGEIDNVFADDLEIDGELYDYQTAEFLDGDDLDPLTGEDAEEFQEGGEVTVFLNRDGDVVYITGNQEEVASTTEAVHTIEAIQGYKTAGNEYIEIEYVDQNGNGASEVIKLKDLDMITYEGTEYDIDDVEAAAQLGGAVDANSADTIDLSYDGNTDTINLADTDASTDNIVIELKRDDNGNVIEITFFDSADVQTEVELDDKYIDGKKINADTLVFNGTEGNDDNNTPGDVTDDVYDPDDDEITVSTWSELENDGFKIENSTVFFDGTGAEYIVVKYTDADDTTMFNGVITSFNNNIDGDLVRIKAIVDGEEKTFNVDELNVTVAKGDAVQLEVNDANNLVEGITLDDTNEDDYNNDFAVTGEVVNVNLRDDEITLDFDGSVATTSDQITFELIASATVVDATDLDDITVENLRDVDVTDTVTLTTDEDATIFIDFVIIK